MKRYTWLWVAAAASLCGCFMEADDDGDQDALAGCQIGCDEDVTECRDACSGDACFRSCDSDHDACVAACER